MSSTILPAFIKFYIRFSIFIFNFVERLQSFLVSPAVTS